MNLSRRASRQNSNFTLLILMLGCALLALNGCASKPQVFKEPPGHPAKSQTEELLRAEANQWRGTPHRMGGNDREGVDCSGLVVQVYKNLFNIRLPRTTREQLRVGIRVQRSRIQAGDLLFFLPEDKTNHVGIYLGGGEFVHASNSEGVMISEMSDPYWRGIFSTARRVL